MNVCIIITIVATVCGNGAQDDITRGVAAQAHYQQSKAVRFKKRTIYGLFVVLNPT
jgi:hypothetical protein